MTVDQSLTSQERLADLDLDAAAPARRPRGVRRRPGPVPRHGLGRGGVVGRQRHPGRAVLPGGVRDGAGRVLRPGDRQPRPPRVRAAFGGAVRFVLKGGDRPEEPAARPPPPPRRRHRRHRARGARRRPLRRARPCARRHDPRRTPRRHRRARHRAGGRDRRLRRHPPQPRRPLPLHGPVPARLRRPHERVRQARGRAEAAVPGARPRRRQRRARPDGRVGGRSTTGSWASPTWPSSSATTSPPSTPR